jgi:hypothetical protein
MPLKLLVTLLLTAVSSAQVPPRLCPRIVLQGDAVGASFWLLAPDIVIVKVHKATWVGPEIEITPPKRLVVRLVRVEADVENSIRGKLAVGPVRFYFFANRLSANGYHTIFWWLEPGKRYAVFLREEASVLRTMADVWAFNIPICSGRHDQLLPGQSGPAATDPGKAIAYAALTPAADYERGFASGIQEALGEIAQFVPPGDAAGLLRGLLEHPDEAIRARACLALTRQYAYRDPCLPGLTASQDPDIRQQAEMWLLKRQKTSQGLVASLKEDPFSLSVSGQIDAFPGELEQFTFDSDAAVRQQACDTLHRFFPERRFPNCGPESSQAP